MKMAVLKTSRKVEAKWTVAVLKIRAGRWQHCDVGGAKIKSRKVTALKMVAML